MSAGMESADSANKIPFSGGGIGRFSASATPAQKQQKSGGGEGASPIVAAQPLGVTEQNGRASQTSPHRNGASEKPTSSTVPGPQALPAALAGASPEGSQLAVGSLGEKEVATESQPCTQADDVAQAQADPRQSAEASSAPRHSTAGFARKTADIVSKKSFPAGEQKLSPGGGAKRNPARPGVTVPQPFTLATKRRAETNARIAEQARPLILPSKSPKPGQMRASFHNPQVPPKPAAKPATSPEPFKLESLKRHEEAQDRLRAQVEAQERELEQKRRFKAQPISHSPPPPAPRPAPPSSAVGFNFAVDERAQKRREFDERLAAKEKQKSLESKSPKQSEEDEELKKYRQGLVFKAAPLPKFYKATPRQRAGPAGATVADEESGGTEEDRAPPGQEDGGDGHLQAEGGEADAQQGSATEGFSIDRPAAGVQQLTLEDRNGKASS